MAGLLPKMHERYFFLSDVLALVYAASARTRGGWRIFALVESGSTCAVFAYISNLAGFAALGAVLMILGTWLALRQYLASPPSVESPVPAHADIPLWNAVS
jgi:hypothetical protein